MKHGEEVFAIKFNLRRATASYGAKHSQLLLHSSDVWEKQQFRKSCRKSLFSNPEEKGKECRKNIMW